MRIYFNLDWVTIYANPFYRLLEFMIGVILAKTVCTDCIPKVLSSFINPNCLIASVLFMIFSISVIRHYYHINDFMLFNWIVLPCLILITLNLALIPFKSISDSPIISYLSGIAFTFFLCQVLPLWDASRFICKMIGSDNNFLKIAISLAICLLGSVLIHEGIEKPASKYLRIKLLK